jgi:hypothetical protein
MRTTVTLDPDVVALLKEAALRTGKPFKTTLNQAVRAGLGQATQRNRRAISWPVFDMGQSPVDLTKALSLADELDDRSR